MRPSPIVACCVTLLVVAGSAAALESPWISDVYFYWYQWDYQKKMGNWVGGVYNTPLGGYYDSSRLDDNLRQLHMASEWGITHHFMDFWGHAWLDEIGRPRERCVMDAAEEMRNRGYDCWMSFYQDGEDFQMDDFARNMDPGRHVEGLVRLYSKSPAWPCLDGKPLHLVYGRNGSPKTTADDEGFRLWLQRKYGSLEELQRWWKQDVANWNRASWNPSALGVQRADSILYQYDLWHTSWAEVNKAAQDRFGLPGLVASFDIAYQPYKGWGYSLQTKTFCGPHSYGGIFGQPHDQDAERFIQAAVAKWYGTAFFDTFKNFYHDWEIRIPGMCYPPDPHAFDRFWTVALSHYAEALLHLSWNEWWEGSNLEPCWEYGKIYCEKNLLYTTVMKACFESIKYAQVTGSVAVLLNDWHWLVSGQQASDIHAVVQALRAASVDFKLLPDDFVTAENLRDVRLVVAPTGGTGLGFNAQGKPIGDVLAEWLEGEENRRLVVGKLPGDDAPAECGARLKKRLGLRTSPPTAKGQPVETINAFLDVGEEGDDRFLISGRSQREDWGKLPEEAFGARERRHTVRWCPAMGHDTTLVLPVAPAKDHILALAGDALWENEVTVYVHGQAVGTFAIKPGYNSYELKIPAAVIPTSGIANLRLEFARTHVPGQLQPERFRNELRVCNLAIDWVHLRTVDQPADVRTPVQLPAAEASFTGPLAGVKAEDLSMVWEQATADSAQVLSSYNALGINRDMVLRDRRAWYCNGLLGEIKDSRYWRAVLDWAGVSSDWAVQGDSVIGARLRAGTTTMLTAYNTDITRRTRVSLTLPQNDWPLAEAQALSEDGETFRPLRAAAKSSSLSATVTPQYYGLYQFTFCPVGVTVPELVVAPNTERSFRLTVENLTTKPVRGSLTLRSYLPSLTAPVVTFSVAARAKAQVNLPIRAREDLDWGTKTAIVVVMVNGREALFWRPVTALAEPALEAHAVRWEGEGIRVGLTNPSHEWAQVAAAEKLTVSVGGKRLALADAVDQGCDLVFNLPATLVGTGDRATLEVSYEVFGRRRTVSLTMDLPARCPQVVKAPKDAFMAFAVDHPTGKAPEVIYVDLPPSVAAENLQGPLTIRDAQGREAPASAANLDLSTSKPLRTIAAVLPSDGPGPFFLCKSDTAPLTDLSAETLEDGRVRVHNSEITAVFDPAKGGTMTELRWRGGRNLAQNSFGASWGRWGRFNPLKPAINAQDFLSQERKAYQWQAKATVDIASATPTCVVVRINQDRLHLKLQQAYFFWAYVPYFRVWSTVTLKGKLEADEVAVLDIPLERGDWDKIYPNFTGCVSDKDAVHGGWREAPYVPPFATVMSRAGFRSSLSLVVINSTPQVQVWRQGFYPRKRGTVGRADTARLELVAKVPKGPEGQTLGAGALVLLHDGYQATAEERREGLLDVEWRLLDSEGSSNITGTQRRDWWSQAWDVRVAVEGMPGRTGLSIRVPLRHGEKWIAPDTLVAVWQGKDGLQVLAATAKPVPPAHAIVTLDAPTIELGAGKLYVYGRLGDQVPVPEEDLKAGVPNPSFEQGARGWDLADARIDDQVAHSGTKSVVLQAPQGGHSLVSTAQVDVRPEENHRVRFWARTEAPGAKLNLNFYAGADYDFLHIAVDLVPDGQWHQYEIVLPAGHFPPWVHPALRLWVYHTAGPVWVDDVEMEIKVAPPAEGQVTAVETLFR